MSRVSIYHVRLGKRRTTVSLDNIISILLAIKFDVPPQSKEAHGAVCKYLQEKLDEAKDPGRFFVSQWLRDECILDLMDKTLSKKYSTWVMAN